VEDVYVVTSRPDEHIGAEPSGPQPDSFFRGLFDLSPEPVLLTDVQSNAILDANQAACNLTGWSRDELMGADLARLCPSRSAAEVQDSAQPGHTPNRVATEDVLIQKPSGEVVPARASAAILTLPGRRVIRWVLRDHPTESIADDRRGQSRDQLAALNAVANTLGGSLDLEDILRRALDQVLETMKVDAGLITSFDPQAGEMPLMTHCGLSDGFVERMRGQWHMVGTELADTIPGLQEAILIQDLQKDPRVGFLGEDFEKEGLRSSAAVPLQSKGKVTGLLAVASREPHKFTSQDVGILTAISSQIGMALENAALHQQQRQRVSQLEALRKTTLDISRQLDLTQLLQSIVERASALMGTTGGGLYLYHEEEEELELVVSQYLGDDLRGTRLKLGEGLSGKVVLTGEPMLVEDYQSWVSRSPHYEGMPFRGVAAVPLKWGDRILGVVNLTDLGQARSFTDSDLSVLELFANQAAIAIGNARLYSRQERRSHELMTLHDISLHITSRTDVDSVLDAIVVGAAELLGGPSAELYLCRPHQGDLKGAASTGLSPELAGGVLQRGEGVAGTILLTEASLIVDDYDSWEGRSPAFAGSGLGRVVGVPIKYGTDLLGVLVVDRPSTTPPFRDNDVNLLTLLANQAAIAIENARLHDQTKQRLEELSAIEEIVGELSSTLDLGKVISMVLDKAVEATEASVGSIGIVAQDRESLIWLAHRGYASQAASGHASAFSTERGIVGRVARTGELALVDDVSKDVDYIEVVHDTRSQLTAPIVIDKAVAGVIALESPRLGGFTQEHAAWVQHLAEHAAVAMDNAQLYERLRRSEERYRAYVENVPDAIWEADADGRFTYWSPQVESLTGYAPEELLEHTAAEVFVHPDDAEEFKDHFRRLIQEKSNETTIHLRALHKYGSPLDLEVSVKPVWGDDGRLIKYGGVARDVSERIRLQAHVVQSAKLSAVGQMIAGVAHELNNPLTTIIGYTQLLQAREADDSVQADLQRIYEGASRAQRIVQNLLTFSRQKKPERTPTDVNEVIEHTMTLRGYELQEDDVEVITDLADNLPWTMADGYQLEQVFLNIVNNAHQAMSQLSGTRILTVRSALTDPNTIRITFSDTGGGIPQAILDKVFDPFFTTRDVGLGTGLGLSIAHGIVQEHNGRIWAESTQGEGATFIVELPVKSWVEDMDVPTSDDWPAPSDS
jgi:PAS domain S-box-containing protein